MWSDSEDEEFVFEKNWLPNIETLSFGFKHHTGNTAILGSDTLKHLRILGCPSRYYPMVLKAAKGVKCLELKMRTSWRGEARASKEAEIAAEEEHQSKGTILNEPPVLQEIIKKYFQGLDNLCELSMDLVATDLEPMGVNDLVGLSTPGSSSSY